MLNYVTLAFYGLCVFLLYRIVQSFVVRRRHAAKARELGCKPLPRVKMPWWDPLGVSLVRRTMAQTADHTFLDLVEERTADMEKEVGYANPSYQWNILGNDVIMTNEPRNVQALLATQFQDFVLPEARVGNLSSLLGYGIFTTNGKQWEHSRAMIRPSFVRERVGDLDLNNRHCQNLMKALPTNADGWTDETDLQVLFFRLTLDSSTEFLFGESVGSQIHELERKDDAAAPQSAGSRDEQFFAVAFDRAQYHIARRARMQSKYYLYNPRGFRDACRNCHSFIDHYVQLALNQGLKGKDLESGAAKDKSRYIFLEELAQQTRDPIELRSQLLNVLLAGRDTTASLLGWQFYLLARNPDKFARLREAVLEEFGAGDDADGEEVTFAKLKGCQYMQWCLNETLRLYPAVPVNARQAAVDTTLPVGGGPDGKSPVFVPKGTNCVYSVYVMQRHEALFGADAKAFRPERWQGRRMDWSYCPFNGGPRICLGQQFALTAAGFATMRLMQRFDAIENLDAVAQVLQNTTLTTHPTRGVRVRLHEAAASKR